jgi:hypothetical protein
MSVFDSFKRPEKPATPEDVREALTYAVRDAAFGCACRFAVWCE